MIVKRKAKLWDLFITWFSIGIQSFGGGTSTLMLISQASLKHGWMGEDEFARLWALVQIAPGINLVKLTLLIGYRLRGWAGLVASMAGLLLPSAAATALMTAGYTLIRDLAVVKAALRGILPATIGLGLAMSANIARPLFTQAYREGTIRLGAHVLILAGAAVLMALGSLSPVVIMVVAGTAAVLLLAVIPAPSQPPEKKAAE
jgi:chromate transporter